MDSIVIGQKWNFEKVNCQQVFTCSKFTLETLEQGVIYVQS